MCTPGLYDTHPMLSWRNAPSHAFMMMLVVVVVLLVMAVAVMVTRSQS